MMIYANGGRFMVAAFGFADGFKTKGNKDGTLDVWNPGKPYPVQITTGHGDFIEAVDTAGNVVEFGGDGGWLYITPGKKPLTLRFKKFAPLDLSAADLDKQRMPVKRWLASGQPYSLDIPDTIVGVIEWMKGWLEKVPPASRENATFDFDTTMEHGETYPRIEIGYTEPETDEEVIRRLQVAAERARLTEARELAQLAALKAKHG